MEGPAQGPGLRRHGRLREILELGHSAHLPHVLATHSHGGAATAAAPATASAPAS